MPHRSTNAWARALCGTHRPTPFPAACCRFMNTTSHPRDAHDPALTARHHCLPGLGHDGSPDGGAPRRGGLLAPPFRTLAVVWVVFHPCPSIPRCHVTALSRRPTPA